MSNKTETREVTTTKTAREGAVEVDLLSAFLARYDVGDDLRASHLPAEGDTAKGARFLAFGLLDEHYAVSIMEVREILKSATFTEIPRAPIEVLGVLSKRGQVMPVIDLGATLGLRDPDPVARAEQRVLVVGEGQYTAGLRVDVLEQVVEFRADQIEEVPAALGAQSAHFLRGLGRSDDRIYILLDAEEVLHALAQAAEERS